MHNLKLALTEERNSSQASLDHPIMPFRRFSDVNLKKDPFSKEARLLQRQTGLALQGRRENAAERQRIDCGRYRRMHGDTETHEQKRRQRRTERIFSIRFFSTSKTVHLVGDGREQIRPTGNGQ